MSWYWGCFLVGTLLTLVLATLGDFHLGHVAGHNVHGQAGGHIGPVVRVLSWLSPLTLTAAVLVFGGVGLIFGHTAFAFPAAVIAGCIAFGALRLLMRAFQRSSTAPLSAGAEGAIATVNATIRPDGAGQVVFTLEGLHRTMPAKSSTGLPLNRGTEVVITHCDRGFAWVEPLDTAGVT